MNLTLADIERCLTGTDQEGQDTILVNAVQTDSRLVEKGDIFICLNGENFDGHEFVDQAIANGAIAVVCSQILDVAIPCIMVRDTVIALGQIAALWRNKCNAKLIAVTGTAGKTTVKEMLFAVLSQKLSTAKNYRNFNNQIGLPMSMLKARQEHEVWIMELGISQAGDMEALAPIANPDIAIITNTGPGHLEGLGDEAGVAAAKTVLLDFIQPEGKAIVSHDYAHLRDAASHKRQDILYFSSHDHTTPCTPASTDKLTEQEPAFVCAFLGSTSKPGHGLFRLCTPDGETEFIAPFSGTHFAENIACVAAVAALFDLQVSDVITGLQTVAADRQRFCCQTVGNALLINDSYNANPLSMARSIKAAAEMALDRPLVLVLGDMLELGEEAVMRHHELGKFLTQSQPKAVFYKGHHDKDVSCGMGNDLLVHVESPQDVIEQWDDKVLHNAVILVKGSRSLKMELFANALAKALGETTGVGE